MTLDEVISYNLRRARELRGWTQGEAAERISAHLPRGWSPQVYGDAERAFRNPKRVKVFTGEEMLALSLAFGLHLIWFYLPPEMSSRVAARGSAESISGEDLVLLLLPSQKSPELEARTDDLRSRLAELEPSGELSELITPIGVQLREAQHKLEALRDEAFADIAKAARSQRDEFEERARKLAGQREELEAMVKSGASAFKTVLDVVASLDPPEERRADVQPLVENARAALGLLAEIENKSDDDVEAAESDPR